jgi:hypothetical protein
MKLHLHSIFLTFLIGFSSVSAFAAKIETADFETGERRRTHNRFIGMRMNSGMILPIDDFTRGLDSRYYQSLSLRFGFRSTGENWRDFAYGMPYAGLGLYVADFPARREVFGTPIAIYMFHGGTLRQFSSRFSLHYEWNLGASFNWQPYDPFDNPKNTIIGSSTNVYASINAYTRWRLSPRIDLNMGAGFNHFSNGAARLPNTGMNLFSPFIELTYTLDNNEAEVIPMPPLSEFERRIDYNFKLTISSRQIRMDTLGTGLPSEFLNYNFSVLGFSFTPLFVPNHRYKYGISLDVVYDASSNARAWREMNPRTGHLHDRVQLAPLQERFAVGLSARGEITMPTHTLFANVGYNFIQQTSANRFYQVIGIKIYPREEMFATFGIRATHFSRAQYLYWSLGYTLAGRGISRRR